MVSSCLWFKIILTSTPPENAMIFLTHTKTGLSLDKFYHCLTLRGEIMTHIYRKHFQRYFLQELFVFCIQYDLDLIVLWSRMHLSMIQHWSQVISWDWTGHDDIIIWKHFPCHWPFVWGIHWSPVDSPHKGQWRGALMFSLICAWTNAWANNQDACDLRCHHAHYDVNVIQQAFF